MNKFLRNYKLPLSQSDRWLERAVDGTFLLLCLLLLLPFGAWAWLPAKIPIQWDVSGIPIQWANKAIALFVVLILLVFAGLVQLIARIFSRHPEYLQQIVIITEGNVRRQYRILRTFSYVYMLELNLASLFAAWHMVQTWFEYTPTSFISPNVLLGLVIVTGLLQLGLSLYNQ